MPPSADPSRPGDQPLVDTQPPTGTVGAPGGRIPRFVLGERLAHWIYAFFFLAAFISGLLMWIPGTREWMEGARRSVAHYHGALGVAMVVIPLILMLVLDRRRLARDIREMDVWSTNDRRWFWAALGVRTLRGGEMPPQGRFNAGQKANAVTIAAMALGFFVTGSLLLNKAGLPAWLVSRALWLHEFLAISGMVLFAGHLAHVFLTKHGRGYLSGMVRGTLPEEIARERHRTWWEESTGRHEAATHEEMDETGG